MKTWITGKSAGLTQCPACHLLVKMQLTACHCPRCHAALHVRKPDSISRTWALVIAACILYIPANLLPITKFNAFGSVQADTIISGVMYFIKTGSWPIALVIFIASVFVPLLKLILLIYLLISLQTRARARRLERTRLYRITELVGRWSMVDIYVVTILVVLVNLGGMAKIAAGPGAFFFALVVVLTMLAAMSFDPRLIWDDTD
jgi:paraquat-inducible protein A